MVDTTPPNKRARPSRRQLQAAQTRRDIVAAAGRLFVERGYGRTTVNDIAEAAGVALQTVYASVGPKSAIALALADLIDEQAGLDELASQAAAETDPHRVIAWAVQIPRRFVERCGDYMTALISAAAVEPDAARAVDVGWQRHSDGALLMARKLQTSGALRPGVSLEDAHAALALTTWATSQFQARQRLGWDGRTWERWCVELLTGALLVGGPPASR